MDRDRSPLLWVLVLSAVCGWWPWAALGQSEDATAWFRREWQQAAEWRPAEPFLLTYEVVVPPEVLAALVRSQEASYAAAKPEVREFMRPGMEEDARIASRGKGLRARYRLWCGVGGLRLSFDAIDRKLNSWRDEGRRDDAGWSLVGDVALTVTTRARGAAGGRDSGVFGTAERARDLWLRGGLGFRFDLSGALEPRGGGLTADGAAWSGRAVDEFGGFWEFEGVVSNDDHAQPLVSMIRVSAPPAGPESVGTKPDEYVLSGWSFEPIADRWLPGTIEWRVNGAVHEVWTRVSVDRVPEQEFVELTTPPSIDRPDPIRGKLAVKVVNDYRPGVEESVLLDGGEVVQRWDTEPVSTPAGTFGWLRFGGWGLAVACGACIGVMVWRRASGRSGA